MAWTKLDRDEVSAEQRELGAFAGRRVVDNIDALARERLPGATAVVMPEGLSSFQNRRLATAKEGWMPSFWPMPAEAHKAKVVLQAFCNSSSFVVDTTFAVGLPGGDVSDTATELPVFGTSTTKYEFELDLAEIQRTGVDFLPLLMRMVSRPSTDPADAVSVALGVTYGDQNVVALKGGTSGFNGNASFVFTAFDVSKGSTVDTGGLGDLQTFYNSDAVGAGTDRVYWIWPRIPNGLVGPGAVGDQLDLVRLSSMEIVSIHVEFESDPLIPFYSPRAMPTQQNTAAAQLQVSNSMPMRTSPEHAMLSSQDYLLASRPAIYGVGPQTADNMAYMVTTATNNSGAHFLRVPLRTAQKARQLDGADGHVRAFEIVLGVIGVAADGDSRDVTFTAELKTLTMGTNAVPPPETVTASTDVTYTVAFDPNLDSYSRNVLGFNPDGLYSTSIQQKHMLHGLFPSWEWYRNRLTMVRVVIEEDAAQPRAEFLDISVENTNDEGSIWHLYSTTWFVRDLPGSQWQTKVKGLP